MEIRVLRYFLEIARAGNMSRAAETLHVSQPALSKQMKDLEQELGKKLFRRGSAGLSLTDEGMLLRKRAEDIVDMVDKTRRPSGPGNSRRWTISRAARRTSAARNPIRSAIWRAPSGRLRKNIRCSAITSPAATRSRWWSGWTGA